ncbi:hypothetical protein Pfo_020353 [Paulownia fortunei]|nr:hypothetical protein Pfo_020353 [Paulownia fortunei]
MIATLLEGMIQYGPTFEIKYVQHTVKDKYGYEISYHKAWHNLVWAKENVYGAWESSVRQLAKYMREFCTIVEWHHVNTKNPKIKMLKYVFWAFKLCIDGFQHCRKIISADGTHLFTKYKHKMLVAVGGRCKSTCSPSCIRSC